MTIDEAIKQFKEDAEYNRTDLDLEWAEENEQFAEWLEELKELRELKETYRKGMETSYSTFMYNKALDDFISNAEEERTNLLPQDEYDLGIRAGYQYSIVLAEKMKGGVNNDD